MAPCLLSLEIASRLGSACESLLCDSQEYKITFHTPTVTPQILTPTLTASGQSRNLMTEPWQQLPLLLSWFGGMLATPPN